MKKIYLFLLIAILVVSIAFAAPPGQAKKSKTTTSPEPQVIVIQNQTGVAPNEGVNWEFVGALVAIFAAIAGVTGWLLSRRQRGVTAKYLKEINKTFNDYKSNANKCETALYGLKEKIEDDFSHGKIKDSAFSILDSRVEKYLSEVRKDLVNTNFQLDETSKKEIEAMLEDGIITEDEFKKFSKMKLNELSVKEKQKLKSLMKSWKSKKRK